MSQTSIIEGRPAEARIEFAEESFELFPTRFVHRVFSGVEGLNARLSKLILGLEASAPSVVRSNIGGYHSESDFFLGENPELKVLKELVRASVFSYVEQEKPGVDLSRLEVGLEGWANVVRSGDYVAPHVHPRSNFAVVYYVDAGDPETELAGVLELLDPRNRVQMVGGPGTEERDAFRLRPRTGSLVVFPAWMYHFVHAYRGSRPRICVAVNAIVRERMERQP